MKTRWALSLAPALLGFILATVLERSANANIILRASSPLSGLLLLLGIGITGLWIGWILLAEWYGRRQTAALSQQKLLAIQERQRFMQRLDHELKNPLTAIHASIANLASAPDNAERQVALSTLSSQTTRLSRLTADLRKIAELEAQPLTVTAVDLHQLLAEMTSVMQEKPEAAQRQINLILPQAPWPLPHVAGDWDLLFQALYNLADNALKYTRTGDTIEIRARQDGDLVAVEIADTGIGIPADALPHIWEELYRSENGRSIPGSGLGLALVKIIVQRHRGNLLVESKIGKGTNVTLWLPIANQS